MTTDSAVARLRALPRERRIIPALDLPDAAAAAALAERLGARAPLVKVGLELFTAAGGDVVRRLADAGRAVFLDLKLHDIPNTVAGAVRAAARLPGVAMLTLHAAGGPDMIATAAEAAAGAARPPALLAVTVLTSLDDAAWAAVCPAGETTAAAVERLAGLAVAAGADGLVCSPRDVAPLRRRLGTEPLLVTPGIRPAGAAADDQRRTAAPAAAVAAGADFLVIGRPITRAPDPAAALAALCEELSP